MIAAPVFRFDEENHAYFLGDQQIPSITQLVKLGGYVKGQNYFKDHHRERGHEIHALCAAYDLGDLKLDDVTTHRGHVLGYVERVRQMKPTRFDGSAGWEEVEVADAHPTFRFGGRRDRLGMVWERPSIGELKSGAVSKEEHGIQLALQAILAEARYQIPARLWVRFGIYTRDSGKCHIYEFDDDRDYNKAFKLIKEFCGHV